MGLKSRGRQLHGVEVQELGSKIQGGRSEDSAYIGAISLALEALIRQISQAGKKRGWIHKPKVEAINLPTTRYSILRLNIL